MHLLLADSGLSGLTSALGINWQVLLLNAAAFLVVVWILGKWVYPPLIKALDAKMAELETTTKARQEAEAHLKHADADAAKIVADARAAADELVANAREESSELVKTTIAKAQTQAQVILDEARAQLDRDIEEARRQLKTETAKLVAEATETILNEKLDQKKDQALVSQALEGRR